MWWHYMPKEGTRNTSKHKFRLCILTKTLTNVCYTFRLLWRILHALRMGWIHDRLYLNKKNNQSLKGIYTGNRSWIPESRNLKQCVKIYFRILTTLSSKLLFFIKRLLVFYIFSPSCLTGCQIYSERMYIYQNIYIIYTAGKEAKTNASLRN